MVTHIGCDLSRAWLSFYVEFQRVLCSPCLPVWVGRLLYPSPSFLPSLPFRPQGCCLQCPVSSPPEPAPGAGPVCCTHSEAPATALCALGTTGQKTSPPVGVCPRTSQSSRGASRMNKHVRKRLLDPGSPEPREVHAVYQSSRRPELACRRPDGSKSPLVPFRSWVSSNVSHLGAKKRTNLSPAFLPFGLFGRETIPCR